MTGSRLPAAGVPPAAREIDDEDVVYHPLSFSDTSGSRLFRTGGELYRGIPAAQERFYRDLLAGELVSELVSAGLLIDTEATSIVHRGFPLVVRHREIPFVSYGFEWSGAMLRDAGLLVCDLAERLTRNGLTFTDATVWNVLFDGCRPVYVDFTSIEPHGWPGAELELERSFRTMFLEPAGLIAKGFGRVARMLLADYDHDTIEEFARMQGLPSDALRARAERELALSAAPGGLRARALSRAAAARRRLTPPWPARRHPDGALAVVRRLRRELEALSIADPAAEPVLVDPPRALDAAVLRVLDRLRPLTVTDLGCGQGHHARLAATRKARVVALDCDERAVDACYRHGRSNGLAILPLVVNLRNPSPGQGICNRAVASAFDRLAGDLTLALGLVPELALEQRLRLEQIAETFARFSRRWLLVDVAARDGLPPGMLQAPAADAYGRSELLAALAPWFRVLDETELGGGSVLVLCERR